MAKKLVKDLEPGDFIVSADGSRTMVLSKAFEGALVMVVTERNSWSVYPAGTQLNVVPGAASGH